MTEVGNPIREVLYEYLNTNCERITQWYQPFFNWKDAAEILEVRSLAEIEKPYGVIVIGEETGSAMNNVGFYQPIEVWPYFNPGNFIPVDEARREITSLLNKKLLEVTLDGTARNYILEYVGTGRDFYDDGLNAITRRIDFRMPKVRN